MKSEIEIKDRAGRRYLLTKTALIERGCLRRPPQFLVLRKEMKATVDYLRTACLSNGAIQVEIGLGQVGYNFYCHRNGRVQIGCRTFLSPQGRLLIRWAKGDYLR